MPAADPIRPGEVVALPHSPRVVAAGLTVGVAAVAISAILTRWALEGAEPLAISFWRTFAGALALAPAAARHRRRNGPLSSARRRQIGASGAFLGLHFALWLTSLELTTVASSVTLVTMSPIFVALGTRRFLAEHVSRRTVVGMTVAMAGAVAIGLADGIEVDLGARALAGDALAFAGALAVAGYLVLGRAVRRDVAISRYASGTYAVAAGILLLSCVIARVPLIGFDARTWWAIAGIVVGPQLLGHTIFNTLLATVPPTTVSVVVLAEPVGATLLAWLLLSELPAPLFWAAAPLVLLGVAVATSGRGIASEPNADHDR